MSGRSVPAVAVMVLAFYGSSSGVSAVNCNDDGYIKPDILAHKTFTAISGGIYFLTHGSSGNLHTPDCAAALPAINAFLRTMHSTCQQIPPLWCSGKSSGVAPTMMCHGSDIKLVGGDADCTKLQAFLNQVMTASTLDALLADAGVENVWKTMRLYSTDDPDFFEKLTALSDARLEQAQAAFLPFTPETPVERAEYTASLEESAADFKNNRMSSIEAGKNELLRRLIAVEESHRRSNSTVTAQDVAAAVGDSRSDIDNELSQKATQTYVDGELAKKATADTVSKMQRTIDALNATLKATESQQSADCDAKIASLREYVDQEIAARRARAAAADEWKNNPAGKPHTGSGGGDKTNTGTANASSPLCTDGQVDPPDCTLFAETNCGTVKFGTTNVTDICPVLCNACSSGNGNRSDDDDASSSSASAVAIAVPISIVIAALAIVVVLFVRGKNSRDENSTPPMDAARSAFNAAYDYAPQVSIVERCSNCNAKTQFCICNVRRSTEI